MTIVIAILENWHIFTHGILWKRKNDIFFHLEISFFVKKGCFFVFLFFFYPFYLVRLREPPLEPLGTIVSWCLEGFQRGPPLDRCSFSRPTCLVRGIFFFWGIFSFIWIYFEEFISFEFLSFFWTSLFWNSFLLNSFFWSSFVWIYFILNIFLNFFVMKCFLLNIILNFFVLNLFLCVTRP